MCDLLVDTRRYRVKAVLMKKIWKYKFRLTALPFLSFAFYLYHSWLLNRLIKISVNVEENPGPQRYSTQYLSICH